MKIVISPDSYKGSLSATEVARAVSNAIHEVDPSIETVLLPVADGGEGTLEPLVIATGGTFVTATVQDPLGKQIEAVYGVLGDKETCVIEMARASGLTLLSQAERNPLKTSTFGTGELIRHALDQGFRKFIVGIGGSATNDGGAGMLRALGVEFRNKVKEEIQAGGGSLVNLEEIDISRMDKRIQSSQFILACDVDNPLLGKNGATAVFGPQKGVTPQMEDQLENGLKNLANKIAEVKGIRVHQMPGAGAAGGLGGAFLALFPVQLKPGIEVVMESIQFEKHLEDADLVITGEGKTDRQTLSGKAPMGVAVAANKRGIPVILLSGFIEKESKVDLSTYFSKLVSIVDHSVSVEESLKDPIHYLTVRTKEIMQAILKEEV
ncbi:glycerate kinase [Psychrobacillus sp. BL-248-WT-3]|uniref:glycerate kinase n=1 Tax=Psychrobacillus sp. BL-248-WT-3 TaxID=2725306 RepID=UPI00146A89A5|nr:glycerate kinase [Psychrobacillus sp. BL-248-WT-3]NME05000.1 glycerate kinase [Psychrobacillus sp. BL-248-WT-3]